MITPEDVAFAAAYAEYRQQLHLKNGRTIRRVLARKRANGEAIGMPPVGYRIVRGVDGKKRVEVDPVMGPFVSEAKELYASGRYSIRQLITIMTAKGLRSRNGKVMGVSSFWGMLKR